MHSSAGNLGAQHAARMQATGTGQGPDGGTGPCAGSEPDNGVAIAGGTDNTFDFSVRRHSGNRRVGSTLQWSEPRAIFPTAGQGGFTDLDLYVLRVGAGAALTCAAQSNGGQGLGVGDTLETRRQPRGRHLQARRGCRERARRRRRPDARPANAEHERRSTPPARAGSLNPDSNYTGNATSSAALDAQNARRARAVLGRRAGPALDHHTVPGRRVRPVRYGPVAGTLEPDGRPLLTGRRPTT